MNFLSDDGIQAMINLVVQAMPALMILFTMVGAMFRWLIYFFSVRLTQFASGVERHATQPANEGGDFHAAVSEALQGAQSTLPRGMTTFFWDTFTGVHRGLAEFRDTMEQRLGSLGTGATEHDFQTLTQAVTGATPKMNRVLRLPLRKLNRFVNALPGLVLILGVLTTVLGIANALPALAANAGELTSLKDFLGGISWNLGPSALGIVLFLFLSLLNIWYSSTVELLEFPSRVAASIHYFWSARGRSTGARAPVAYSQPAYAQPEVASVPEPASHATHSLPETESVPRPVADTTEALLELTGAIPQASPAPEQPESVLLTEVAPSEEPEREVVAETATAEKIISDAPPTEQSEIVAEDSASEHPATPPVPEAEPIRQGDTLIPAHSPLAALLRDQQKYPKESSDFSHHDESMHQFPTSGMDPVEEPETTSNPPAADHATENTAADGYAPPEAHAETVAENHAESFLPPVAPAETFAMPEAPAESFATPEAPAESFSAPEAPAESLPSEADAQAPIAPQDSTDNDVPSQDTPAVATDETEETRTGWAVPEPAAEEQAWSPPPAGTPSAADSGQEAALELSPMDMEDDGQADVRQHDDRHADDTDSDQPESPEDQAALEELFSMLSNQTAEESSPQIAAEEPAAESFATGQDEVADATTPEASEAPADDTHAPETHAQEASPSISPNRFAHLAAPPRQVSNLWLSPTESRPSDPATDSSARMPSPPAPLWEKRSEELGDHHREAIEIGEAISHPAESPAAEGLASELDTLKAQLRELEEKIQLAYEDKIAGKISSALWLEMHSKLAIEKDQLQQKIAAVRSGHAA